MGGGVEMEVDLSRGAVAALWRQGAEGLRPVLQVAATPQLVGAPPAQRCRVALSDGARALLCALASPLTDLVTRGALRHGSVVRVLEYVSAAARGQRVIIVIQLEILQAECALIGNPTIYEANAAERIGVSSSGSLGSHEPCVSFMPGAQQAVNNSSSLAGYGLLDSSVSPWAEPAAYNLPFSDCLGSMPAQSMVDAKMQQLSLNDNGNQKFTVSATGYAFGSHGNTYGSPMPPLYLHSTPMYMDGSHAAKNESPLCITPINALSPYQTRWKIKGRVTAKTDLRHYTNCKGPGKVFSFDLLDAQGGEVRATCFNVQADQYFDLIEVDKVYLMSKGSVKLAQKKFNPLNNDFEILVDHTSSIEICCGDESSFPGQQYNFMQINEIENMEIGVLVDLVGIVTSVGPSVILMRRDGTQAQKRTLQLKDLSGRSVEIIFWGKFSDAEGRQLQLLCDSGSSPILALKGCRLNAFSGTSVCTISSTQLKVNPDCPEAERLRQWYMAGGKNAPCISLSQGIPSMNRSYVEKTIAQIKDENLGRSEKPDLINVRAAISYVKPDSFCYPSCIMELNGKQCAKKVTSNGDGTWSCDRCNQRSENCEYRYLLLCQIKDGTSTVYATAFQEAGEKIVGHTAQELFMARYVEQDHARFTEIMEAVLGREYLLKLRIKEETFNGEQRVKCYIVGAEKLDVPDMNHHVLDEIDSLLKDVSLSTPSVLRSTPQMFVGSANLEAGQGVQTSSRAHCYGTGVGGIGPSSSSVIKDCASLCFACSQPGHWAKDCPVRAI